MSEAKQVEPQQITQLLAGARAGDARAADRLLPLVYDELRRLAQARLNGERPGQTLQATALVHDAYLRMIPQSNANYADRSHFFRVAALQIRRILVERARSPARRLRVELDESPTLGGEGDQAIDYAALHDALAKLAAFDPVAEQIVNLRYFAGLNMDQIAEALEMPKRTVERDWADARAWLRRELNAHA